MELGLILTNEYTLSFLQFSYPRLRFLRRNFREGLDKKRTDRHDLIFVHLLHTPNARNGNVEVPVYFSKAKQGYSVRKIEKDKWV
jgi:hypothetical protein